MRLNRWRGGKLVATATEVRVQKGCLLGQLHDCTDSWTTAGKGTETTGVEASGGGLKRLGVLRPD